GQAALVVKAVDVLAEEHQLAGPSTRVIHTAFHLSPLLSTVTHPAAECTRGPGARQRRGLPADAGYERSGRHNRPSSRGGARRPQGVTRSGRGPTRAVGQS